MSDDFGTVSAKKGDRAREIGRLREHYKNHRDTLSGLMGDAPSEHLANDYQRLIADIDTAVRKLDELEGKMTPVSTPAPMVDTNPAIRPATRPGATAPGNRPLVRPNEPMAAPVVATRNPRAIIIMMVIAGLIVLGAIAYLVWKPRTNPRPAIVEQTTSTPSTISETTATAPPTIPAASASSIKVTPALADYGTIRKGTRAVRQFEVTNTSGGPIEIQVARSTCKCLFYDYKAKIAPNGKETITVTIDGARAKVGALQEQVNVTAKGDPSVNASFTVQATIR